MTTRLQNYRRSILKFLLLSTIISVYTGSFLRATEAYAEEDTWADLKVVYTGEEWDNLRGGNKQATGNINQIDVSLALDTEKKFGWKGSSVLIDGIYNNGRTLSSLTGASQNVSPIDTDGVQLFRLYQAWYNQDFFDGKTSALVGLYDLNSEFHSLDSAGVFFNGGFSWNTALDQTGLNGPSSFPNTALAFRLRQKLDEKDGWSVQFVILDGAGDSPEHPKENTINTSRKNGALLVGELDYHPDDHTKVLVGYWNYTAKFDDLTVVDDNGDPRRDSGNQGVYAGIHHRLYSITALRGVDGFISAGVANGDMNQFNSSLAVGLNFKGLIASRPNDQLGLGWDLAHNGSPYKQAQEDAGTPATANEVAWEVTYRAKATDWLTIQPDFQYIENPGTISGLKNDAIIGLHIEIGQGWSF